MKVKDYCGKHTKKAKENFPFDEFQFPKEFIINLALIKAASSKANLELGIIEKKKGNKIFKIAYDISKGKYLDQFPLSIFQTGSGTSTNMNMNEVISNIIKEKYKINVHPNDDVNMCQSSNDVIPTAIYLTTILGTKNLLLPVLKRLEKIFLKKGKEFYEIITVGRTHLQDALPISLGEEFIGYSKIINTHRKNIENSLKKLRFLPLGGTAVGTGLNAHKDFAIKTIKYLSRFTDLGLKEGKNHFELQSSIGNLTIFSSSIKNLSLELFKIMQDLKLKNYFGEISISPLQEGSSIMPGKVNPVALEVMQQICFDVLGKELSISLSSFSSNFELNTFLPLVAYNLYTSIELLSKGIDIFIERTLKNLNANAEICKKYAENSPAIITPLSLKIGYDKAQEIVEKANYEKKSVLEFIREKNILPEKEIKKIFDLKKIAFPFNLRKNKKR